MGHGFWIGCSEYWVVESTARVMDASFLVPLRNFWGCCCTWRTNLHTKDSDSLIKWRTVNIMHYVHIISTGIVIVSSRVGEAPADNYRVWLVIMRKFWQQRYQSHPNTWDSDSTLTAKSANLKGKTLCLYPVSLVDEIGNTEQITHLENLLYGVMERLPVGWTIGRNAPSRNYGTFSVLPILPTWCECSNILCMLACCHGLLWHLNTTETL